MGDWLKMLKKAVDDAGSQAAVGRELGYSSAVISQALQSKYPGDTSRLAERVIEVYGNERVTCPVLGVVPLGECAKNQQKNFSSGNPVAVQLWLACQDCPYNRRK